MPASPIQRQAAATGVSSLEVYHYAKSVITRRSPGSGASDKLRDIQAITDEALSHLDAEELLAELLNRLKTILQADTAAVLLHDRA